MRAALVLVMVGCAGGCSTGEQAGGASLTLPRVYPPVRAATPQALIANSKFTAASALRQALTEPGAPSLAAIVQERLYRPGPTEVLQLLQGLDERVAQLDPRPSAHPCLTGEPVSSRYPLPGGQTFEVKLQCFDGLGDGKGWLAFGFGTALPPAPDAGASDGGREGTGPPDGGALAAAGGGNDFYLVEGQAGGMGSAYHIDRRSGSVEGWLTVADRGAPANSQVIMHLLTDRAAGTFELTLGGSSVGLCAAHLKMGGGFLFINARTNAPPPPGTPMGVGTQSCEPLRAGCFDATMLDHDLGASDVGCSGIGAGSFAIPIDLDASTGPGANVTPSTVYTYFEHAPSGVPAF